MERQYPRYTVFVPVKNGRNYIAPCIESILAQTYTNFVLVVLAGFSSDGTCAWLKDMESRDPRIKVLFSEHELGIEANWGRILAVPKNEFMTIVGYDDLLDPDFLDVINQTIDEDSSSDLYLAHFRLIDDQGKLIRNCKPIPEYETAAGFLAARMAGIRDTFGTGYVMRSAVYDKLGGIPPYPDLLSADDALWMMFMRNKPKITSSRICFSYRYHSGSVSGSANLKASFDGLRKYFELLEEMGRKNDEIAYARKVYGPIYAVKICQMYYCYLYFNKASIGSQFEQEILSIRKFLGELSSDAMLDESCAHFLGRLKLRLRKLGGKINRALG